MVLLTWVKRLESYLSIVQHGVVHGDEPTVVALDTPHEVHAISPDTSHPMGYHVHEMPVWRRREDFKLRSLDCGLAWARSFTP
ncbi:MAG: hypothetical protein V3S24_18370 [Candidatus Tectomicrobia bacterium]